MFFGRGNRRDWSTSCVLIPEQETEQTELDSNKNRRRKREARVREWEGEREREEKWEIFLAAANHFSSAVAREHSVRESLH